VVEIAEMEKIDEWLLFCQNMLKFGEKKYIINFKSSVYQHGKRRDSFEK
jgi:hypothetical protein